MDDLRDMGTKSLQIGLITGLALSGFLALSACANERNLNAGECNQFLKMEKKCVKWSNVSLSIAPTNWEEFDKVIKDLRPINTELFDQLHGDLRGLNYSGVLDNWRDSTLVDFSVCKRNLDCNSTFFLFNKIGKFEGIKLFKVEAQKQLAKNYNACYKFLSPVKGGVLPWDSFGPPPELVV